MQKVILYILSGFMFLLAGGIILGWFWGVPYLFTLFIDGSYWFFATIWVSIHLVTNIIGRMYAQKQLKELIEKLTINKLKG